MNILLVDDSKPMRNLQKRALGVLGELTFSDASDGLEALKVIAAHPEGFSLILIDWNMPNMDGLQLITRIRETDRKTPLLMVTTEGDEERVRSAFDAGINNYVIKPFTPDALVKKVRETLAMAA
jgi:two-component system chemotaxis response regulator CheY